MRDLTLFTLGKYKYGIWQDQAPTVKEIEAIHWLPPAPKHIAGLSILDGQTVTLFDLPACIGFSPISKEKQSYPVLLIKNPEKIVGFIIDVVMGHFAIQSEAVLPMPDFLQTPIIDSCAIYDSEPIPIINLSKLFKSVLEAEFKPPLAKHCISGFHPEYNFSVKTVRVFECGGESFAVSGACIKKRGLKPGRITKPAQLPRYVSGITFHDENLVALIHMPRRMQLPEKKPPELMLVADIGEQTFGLLVDSDNDEWHDKYFTVKPLPSLVQGDWMQDAVLHGKEIIPIIEPVGLIFNQSDGFNRTPLPQRYTPSSKFKSIFGKEDVQVFEFSLLGARHALPHYEVEDQFQVKPYRRLPDVMSIVAGVAEYAGELLPVLDLAACFGRDSIITPDWQMLLVKNGDFRVLVLAEAIFGERILPVKMHRGLPFEEPHLLVYGCYPDEAMVRLVLNVEALAVHFDKTLFKNFFTTLSKEIALEPMDIGLESEPEKLETGELAEEGTGAIESAEPEEVEKPLRPERSTDITAALSATKDDKEIEIQESAGTAPPDIKVSVAEKEEIIVIEDAVGIQNIQEIVAPELGASKTRVLEEIGPQMKSQATVGKEEMEEGIRPVEFAETEELFKPEESPASIAYIPAEEAEEAEEKREIKETAEADKPYTAAAVADLAEIPATEEKTDFQETQKIAETKAEGTHVAVSEEFGPEPETEEIGLSGPVEDPEKPAEPEILEKSITPEASLALSVALSTEKEERENENREPAELVSPGIEASAVNPEAIIAQEETAEIQEAQQIVETELEASQTGVSEEIVQEPEPEATEVGGPAQKAKEKIEEGIEPVEFAEAEGPFEPEGLPTSIAFIAAEEAEDAEEDREFKKTAEIASPDMAASAADFAEISATEEKITIQELQNDIEKEASRHEEIPTAKDTSKTQEVQKSIELEREILQASISEKITPQTEPEDQVEEIIELIDFLEPKELIEVEEAPELMLPTSTADTAQPVAELEVLQVRVSEKIEPQTAPEKKEQNEREDEIIELQDFMESEEPTKVEKALERTVLVATEKNIPPINETADADEVFQAQITENIELQKPTEQNEQKEQEEEIFELQDFIKHERSIEVEKASEKTMLLTTEVTALSTAEAANDYCESDTRKRPKIKYALAVCAAILLIGILMVTLYPSGLLNNGMVNKEKGKLKAPIVVAKHRPLPVERKKVPKSEKQPTISPGAKFVEVKKENAELPTAVAKPKPSPAKSIVPQPPKTAPAVSPNFEIVEAKKEKPEAPPAEEVRGLAAVRAIQQPAPRMVLPESTDIAIHKVEKGDTLWDISKKYTGTGFNYMRVAKENEITNPDLIFPEQNVRVNKKARN